MANRRNNNIGATRGGLVPKPYRPSATNGTGASKPLLSVSGKNISLAYANMGWLLLPIEYNPNFFIAASYGLGSAALIAPKLEYVITNQCLTLITYLSVITILTLKC